MNVSRLILVLLSLCLVSPALAKEDHNEFLLQDAVVATANGRSISTDNFSSIALDLTFSSGTATITFEGSVMGSAWTAVPCINIASGASATTATSDGIYQCNVVGLSAFRARVSAWTSGAVSAFARATTASIGGSGSTGILTSLMAVFTDVWDTANHALKVTMASLLAGENQGLNIMMTGPGATGIITLGPVTSATSSTVQLVPGAGPKTFMAQMTNATSETKAFTLTIFGNWTSSTTGGLPVCTIYFPSTATITHAEAACHDIKEPYSFWYFTAAVYTSASLAPLSVYAME